MNADMQMARDHSHGHNLAIGEPFFLQEALEEVLPPILSVPAPQYPPFRGTEELLTMLRERHNGMHVVVTTGAKQAILASISALNSRQREFVVHPKPHWPSYPTLAKLSGNMRFVTQEAADYVNTANCIRVVTSPNNPDGATFASGCGPDLAEPYDIWDAAYAHKVYGWDGIVPHHRISVWSAAKLYGLCGARIGWLVTADKELADRAALYVEQATSGVSTVSQGLLATTIRNINELPLWHQEALYLNARETLRENAALLRMIDHHFTEPYRYAGAGMFAWVQARNPEIFEDILRRAQIQVVTGEACGGEYGWYRISLGLRHGKFSQAITAFLWSESHGSPQ